MREIRLIQPEELDAFVDLSANAYPGIELTTAAKKRRFKERVQAMQEDKRVHLYGLFEDGKLKGGMRLFDFTMQLLSTKVLIGGVGGVAVDLLHKKEKVAYDMLQFFLHHYRQKGASLTALYPFRPDFYKQMGYGYGTKMQRYAIKPASLPADGDKRVVVRLNRADEDALAACYTRYLARTNGLFERFDSLWETVFEESSLHIVGIRRESRISGYIIFKFESDPQRSFLDNDLLIREWVYDTPDDFRALSAFLHSQADQVNRIIFNTQDEYFHLLLGDPRNGSNNMLAPTLYHESNTEGVGLMYRVIDVAILFKSLTDHDFNGQTLTLEIVLTDSFFPENAGSTVVVFENGRCHLNPNAQPDVTMRLDVSEFSSLVTGAVPFKALFSYGLATLSEPAFVDVVDRLFAAPKPICLTSF